jgi:hypothetical protein
MLMAARARPEPRGAYLDIRRKKLISGNGWWEKFSLGVLSTPFSPKLRVPTMRRYSIFWRSNCIEEMNLYRGIPRAGRTF